MNELVLLEDLGMIYPNESSKDKKRYGLYKCFCGNEFKSRMDHIRTGKTKSCKCVRDKVRLENITTHNLSKHRLYKTWQTLFHRCYNPKRKDYKHYGKRGIKVCDEWKSFNKFIEDMYPTFQEGLTLDRIDVNGNYEKSNCQWANQSIQISKTRILKPIGYRGSYYHSTSRLWSARLMIQGKNINLGYFNTDIEAATARDKYIIDNNLPHTLNFKREGLVNGK